MAIGNKIISFWKQVRFKSSDMFTLFRVGIGIKAPTHKLHVKGPTTNAIKVVGNAEMGDTACDASGGDYAAAFNNSTTASSKDAFACGELTTASGRQAFAGGFETTASGDASVAFGANATASGERSFSQGQESTASGENSVAFNAYSDATGAHSFASGHTTCASGVAAVSFGASTTSSGDRTFATGGSNTASGDDSAVFGNTNTATTANAFAIGNLNDIEDDYSCTNSFIGGYGNTVQCSESFVFGSLCEDAPAIASSTNNRNQFLFGQNLKTPRNVAGAAAGQSQFIVGKYNEFASQGHTLFAVGNGSVSAVSNALTVFATGDTTVGGDLTIEGNDIKDNDGTTCITFDSSGNTTIAGTTSGTFSGDLTGTASVATTVTITDNESTNEDNALIFTAGGDVDGGNIGLESDGTCTYNPSTGKITATGFIGALTGDASGNAATATALESARTINGVSFDGTGNITVTAAGSTLSDTVTVTKGGTGLTVIAADNIVTGNGTSALTAEAYFTYSTSGEELCIGNPDSGDATISRRDSSGTNQSGGNLIISGGAATGNAAGGAIEFRSSVAGSSGSAVQSTAEIATISKEGNLSIDGDLTVGGGDIYGATDGDLTISSDGSMTFILDDDNDETSQSFSFKNDTTEVANLDESGNLQCDGVITGKQRWILNCGFNGSTTSAMYMPFGNGGLVELSGTAGGLEYVGVIAPADGYVEYVVMRSENVCGSSTVGIHVAAAGTEVPSASMGSFFSPAVDMAVDDTAYKFTGFVNAGGTTNSFSAGDVIVIGFDPTNDADDTVSTAVLVLDWNNPLS